MFRPLPLFSDPLDCPSWAVFLDFDGTLVEIADRPEDIVVPAALPVALGALGTAFGGAVAIVSGRTIDVIDGFIGGAVPAVAGLHGWERRDLSGARTHAAAELPNLDHARQHLKSLTEKFPGVLIEDKGASLAIHYRHEPLAAAACHAAAVEVVEAANGALVTLDGKCVVEVKATVADKGAAVRAYLREPPFAGRRPVYIGDDVTDEAGFKAVVAAQGIAVAVGERAADPATAATAYLPDVSAVHAWIGTAARNAHKDSEIGT
ncbi:MAG: trehalose-phosphatase [Rhodobacteraceae bacterium]|nr:trehalose-phosphatase [Paracoccaceae bacterium]